jgi:hypothetical protein
VNLKGWLLSVTNSNERRRYDLDMVGATAIKLGRRDDSLDEELDRGRSEACPAIRGESIDFLKIEYEIDTSALSSLRSQRDSSKSSPPPQVSSCASRHLTKPTGTSFTTPVHKTLPKPPQPHHPTSAKLQHPAITTPSEFPTDFANHKPHA